MNKKEIKTNPVQSLGLFLNRNAHRIAFCLSLVMMLSFVVLASGGGTGGGTGTAPDAEDLWEDLADLIVLWVGRLGGVVMLVGGIMFGLGWKSDDAEQKSRGISTIIAGAIVVAMVTLASRFFAI